MCGKHKGKSIVDDLENSESLKDNFRSSKYQYFYLYIPESCDIKNNVKYIYQSFLCSETNYWTSWGKSSASSGGISSGGLVHFINVSGDRYKNTNLANRSSSRSNSPLSRTRYISRHNCNRFNICGQFVYFIINL